jgi:hypothetical protein
MGSGYLTAKTQLLNYHPNREVSYSLKMSNDGYISRRHLTGEKQRRTILRQNHKSRLFWRVRVEFYHSIFRDFERDTTNVPHHNAESRERPRFFHISLGA